MICHLQDWSTTEGMKNQQKSAKMYTFFFFEKKKETTPCNMFWIFNLIVKCFSFNWHNYFIFLSCFLFVCLFVCFWKSRFHFMFELRYFYFACKKFIVCFHLAMNWISPLYLLRYEIFRLKLSSHPIFSILLVQNIYWIKTSDFIPWTLNT